MKRRSAPDLSRPSDRAAREANADVSPYIDQRQQADRLAKDDHGDVSEVEVPTDLAGLVSFLNSISI